MTTKAEQLAKASKDLMLTQPFFGIFLIMLNKIWSNAIPTAGVGKNGVSYQLILNENFWSSLPEPQRQGLLLHELHHIGFFHVTDFDFLTDRLISNIAADICVNQYIAEYMLPPGPQLPSCYPELKLELKKGIQYYYDKLMQGKQNGNCPNLNDMLKAANEGLGGAIIQIPGKGDVDTQLPDHSTWAEFDKLSEVEKKLVRSQTETILQQVAEQVAKSQGTIPGEFSEILKRIQTPEPPKFNWRRYLRMFTGGSEDTYSTISRKKLNLRYLGMPGIKHRPKLHILLAIDTSGSVSTKELEEFMSEMWHINKTGTEITVIQCDTHITHIGKFNPKADLEINGRGGTDFSEPVEYYNANLGKYSCLMYFTDGKGSTEVDPKGKMLWVLSSSSNKNTSLPGRQIILTHE